jgi:hypothetical protein
MVVAVKSIVNKLLLKPEKVSCSDTTQYNAAVQTRMEELLGNFSFMHSHGIDRLFKNPAIFQGLINFVYSPKKGDALGKLFSGKFEKAGMPIWLIANFGATVCLLSYLSLSHSLTLCATSAYTI